MPTPIPSTFPVLETERLHLRALSFDDSPDIFEIRSDAENRRYLNALPDKNEAISKEFIKKIIDGIQNRQWLYWAICLKSNPILIGTICLWNFYKDQAKAEIGYELHKNHQGKGYMQEALQKIIQYGLEGLHLDEIEAYTNSENLASKKILERNSFQLESSFEENYHFKEGSFKMSVFSLKRRNLQK